MEKKMKFSLMHTVVFVFALLVALPVFQACFGGSSGDDGTDGDADSSDNSGDEDEDLELSGEDLEDIKNTEETEDDAETGGESADEEGEAVPEKFRVAFLADPHIIDDYYEGPESNELDTQTMFDTYDNLIHARDHINSLEPPIDSVYIAGDIVHNYPSTEWDFYFENRTRFDIAAEILDGFEMPVYILPGNHDYDIGNIPREFTQNLFREKFGLEKTYYEIERYGFKFIMLDNFLGSTGDAESPDSKGELGSLGEEQLMWLKERLAEGKPSFVMNHNPLLVMKLDDVGDEGLKSVLEDNLDVLQLSLAGHTHIWMDWEQIYGMPHIVLGSTRYDHDNYMIVEIDTVNQNFTILNKDKLGWGTRNAEPWDGE